MIIFAATLIALLWYFKQPKRYYVHAILGLKAINQYHSDGYRFYFIAYIDAYIQMINHPYGQAVITTSPSHPPIHH